MATAAKIAEWADQAGIAADRIKLDGDNPVVFQACGRCGGAGIINGFRHIENGTCFACGGAKGRYRGLQSLAASARRLAKNNAAAAEERRNGPRRNAAAARAFLAANEGLAVMLRESASDTFLRNLAMQLARKGELSAKQVAAAGPAADKSRERRATKATEEAAETSVPVTDQRQTIAATVLMTREQEDNFSYNGGTILKMLISVDAGEGRTFKLWGSVPSSIYSVRRGDTISFACKYEPSNDDPKFGFFKRPTKATITVEGPNHNDDDDPDNGPANIVRAMA